MAFDLGTTLFKIANADFAANFASHLLEGESSPGENASRFGVSENWTGDLTNGLLKLGEKASQLHGLEGAECGLLTMMRCYDQGDRGHILRLFEQAATAPSRFCYSTTILSGSGQRQPVFCIGESGGFDGNDGGTIVGLFIFPRFRLSAANSA